MSNILLDSFKNSSSELFQIARNKELTMEDYLEITNGVIDAGQLEQN